MSTDGPFVTVGPPFSRRHFDFFISLFAAIESIDPKSDFMSVISFSC